MHYSLCNYKLCTNIFSLQVLTRRLKMDKNMLDSENEKKNFTEIPFHKQMRKATREVHAISDALVNAKLAFALSNDAVWADGLLVFYEIFRFLEGAMFRLKDTHLGSMYNEDVMQRAEAFEKDLAYYLGADWNKNYIPRESVTKYLLHLQTLEQNEPLRLIAYVYHLYMGLLSGGQILSNKRQISNKFSVFRQKVNNEMLGNAVTNFDKRIYDLKKQIIVTVNNIAEKLNESEKQSLIEESKIVFELNNSIIKTVKGTSNVLIRKILFYTVIVCVSIYLFKTVFNLFT